MVSLEERRSVETLRVDARQAVRLLPSVVVAWNGRPSPPTALAALIAGTTSGGLSSTFQAALDAAIRSVGRDYADGFVDGFDRGTVKGKAERRYDEGLRDGGETRLLLRKQPWAQTLIADCEGK